MMSNRVALVLLTAVCLTACGGGGGGGSVPATSALSGVAAVGAPIINGNISVVCAAGSALATTTNGITGAWSVTLSGQTLPCAVEVSGGTINGTAIATHYHSIAIAAGTVNVTPLTDLMVANLAAQNPGAWFASLGNTPTMFAAMTQAGIDAALANLRAALSGLALLSSINPITTSFSATPGNTMDDMLAALQAAMSSSASTYPSLLNAASSASFASVVAALNSALPAAYAGTTSGNTPPVSGSGPGIAGVFPTSGAPGTSVTISGTNFKQGTGGMFSGDAYQVSFNGTTATPSLRTLMQLAVTVPAGATSGALTVTDLTTNQVYTVPGGFVVTGGAAALTFSAIPANGIFTDPANDASVDFIDITGAVLTVNSTDIVFDISLRNIPALFTFNQANVPLGLLEYEWAVDFDINNDGVTDYSLSASSFKLENNLGLSPQTVGPLFGNNGPDVSTQVNVWKQNIYLVPASASLTGNTIRLSVPKSANPDLINITSSARVRIQTQYRSDSTTTFSDSI